MRQLFYILSLFIGISSNAQGLQDYAAQLIEPQDPDSCLRFEKVEFGISIPNELRFKISAFRPDRERLNPFNHSDISVHAVFKHNASDKEYERDGFFYVPYERKEETWEAQKTDFPFRIRFAPNAVGSWSVDVTMSVKGKVVFEPEPFTFRVVPSENPGHLVVSHKNSPTSRYLTFSGTEEGFFAIGENIGWSSYDKLKPDDHAVMSRWICELAENGGNFFRVWMKPPAYGIEWETPGHYGQRMTNAWELDQIFRLAEEYDVYVQLLLCIDEFTKDGGWPENTLWSSHPYKRQFELGERKEYCSDPRARSMFKQRLRYIEARWGWDARLCNYELISEPERLFDYDDNEASDRVYLYSWLNEMHDYLRQSLSSVKPTSMSFMLELNDKKTRAFQEIKTDIVGINQYGREIDENFNVRSGIVNTIHSKKQLVGRPFQFTEMGVAVFPTMEYCTDVSFHNAIWATSFMGCFGTGLNWWWDNAIHPQGYYRNFKALGIFMQDEDFTVEPYEPAKGKDALFYRNAMIEYYGLVKENKTRWVGWVHNNTYWWSRMQATNECIARMRDSVEARFDKADNTDYNQGIKKTGFRPPELLSDHVFKIRGLKRNCSYEVHWFKAHDDGGELEDYYEVVKSNLFGKVKLVFPQSQSLQDADYGVKIICVDEKCE